jgi:hypothetical protein
VNGRGVPFIPLPPSEAAASCDMAASKAPPPTHPPVTRLTLVRAWACVWQLTQFRSDVSQLRKDFENARARVEKQMLLAGGGGRTQGATERLIRLGLGIRGPGLWG